MTKIVLISIISALAFVGCTNTSSKTTNQDTDSTPNSNSSLSSPMSDKLDKYSEQPPTLSAADLKGKTAVVKTAKGNVEIALNGEKAPITVSNFIFLTNEKFYDGLTFHRREPGFVLQGGDPIGTGTGGPGYTVTGEVENGLTHERGAVAMARTSDQVNPERRSSGSQFYITLDDANFLDEQYTVFGRVTKGMDVVDGLEVGDEIISVTIK